MKRTWVCALVCLMFLCSSLLGAESARKRLAAIEAMKVALARPAVSGRIFLAFEQFRKLVRVRMEIDISALSAAGVKESDAVSVKAPKATGEQLLDMILAKLGKPGRPLAWYIDDNTVHVTTQAMVLNRKRLPSPRRSSISARRRSIAPPPAASQPVARTPRTIKTFDFDEMPAEDVFEYLRRISGLNIYVNWAAMELMGIDRDKPITLKASNLSLRQVLSLVTEQVSGSLDKMERVYWVIDDGVVTVAPAAVLNSKMKTRVYDVADLLAVVPNFQAPRISVSGSEGDADDILDDEDDDDDEEDSRTEQRQRQKDTLVEIIRNSIGEEMWLPIGKGSIRFLGNQMIISQSLLGFKLMEETSRRR